MSHRTFRGKEFNMAAFADQNGHVPALGNSGRNARGDIIDKGGRIIATAQEVNAVYNNKNPKAVARVSITKDTEERLAGQTPKAATPAKTATAATPAKPATAPAKPEPRTRTSAPAAPATFNVDAPGEQSDTVVNRRVFMDANGEEKTEITYADGSVEIL